MTVNMVALGFSVFICIILPLLVFGSLFIKKRDERKSIVFLFLLGLINYLLMDWGVKEHFLSFLFNKTDFQIFVNEHYILYLFIVALIGGILIIFPEYLIVATFMKGKFTFSNSIVFGLGYGMMEATMLVGYRSILTMIELAKNQKLELNTSTNELFLSGYERFLIILIRIGILVSFVYFMEQHMKIRAVLIKIFCHTLVMFLPGLFMAFSTKNYYEVYDRSVALVLIYIVLTTSAFTSIVILNSLKYSFEKRN